MGWLLVSHLPKPTVRVEKSVSEYRFVVLTHIKTAHKGNLAIYNTQLLVVGPVKDHLACRSVQRLDRIQRDLRQLKGIQGPHGQVIESCVDICLGIVNIEAVVGVSEDLDVGVQLLEVVLCVL